MEVAIIQVYCERATPIGLGNKYGFISNLHIYLMLIIFVLASVMFVSLQTKYVY